MRALPSSLWPTQLVTLELLAQGYTNGEIARRFMIAPKAVETRVNRLYVALGLSPDDCDRDKYSPRVMAALMWWSEQPLSPGILASGTAVKDDLEGFPNWL